ncbi:MAG: OmpH family outer membrane protein [Defluviimonas sp.]|nr:OmpH family outer membrane protein [Defluviimonas sp.]
MRAGGQGGRRGLRLLALLLLAAGAPSPVAAQTAPQAAGGATGGLDASDFPTGTAVLQAPILTLNDDRLFEQSAWGARAEAEIEAAAAELAAENRRIEAQLLAEERLLTDRRAGMDPAAFRAEADAFDERVTGIRRAQDLKARTVTRMREAERRAFFGAVVPILSEVMRRHGAVVMLDARAIFLADSQIDVTDEVAALANQRLGPGERPVLPEPGGGADDAAETGDPGSAPAAD